MDSPDNASRPTRWITPTPNVSQSLTPGIRLDPRARRTSVGDLIAVLRVGDGLTLHFAGASPDDQAVAAIDHLIGGLMALRGLVETMQSDPDIVAAVSEKVPA